MGVPDCGERHRHHRFELDHSTTDTLVELNGLTENTAYTVYVRTVCGTETSFITSASFRTLCAKITSLPITWDFESDNAGGTVANPLPACWQRTPNCNYPKTTSTGYAAAHSGYNVLTFHNAGTASSNGVGVMTEIDTNVLPINQLQLEFYARMHASYTGATIEVGVLGDPNDINTFQPCAEFPINSTEYNEEPYRVFFNEFTGYGNLIGFRMTNPSSTIVDPLIDDVTLSEIPPCPKVMHLAFTSSTENSVSLSWYGLNDSYYVRYRPVTDTTWNFDITYEDSITITGLNPNSEYLFEVAPNCDTITADMFAPITAWTSCTAASIPYFIDFENDLKTHCWTVAHQGVIENHYLGDKYYPSVETSSSYSYSGVKYVQVGAQGGSTVLVTAPKFYNPIETLRLKLYTREPQNYLGSNTLGTLQLGLMTDPYVDSTFVMLTTIPVSGTSYTLHTYNFDQFSYTGSDYYIAFRYIGAGNDSDDVVPFYVDDITITINSACDEPNTISVNNITTTSAEIGWTGNATAYKVYYRAFNENDYQSQDVPAGDSTLVITGLQPSTHYYYYVASVCSDTSEAPSIVGNFMTECGIFSTFPYHEDFNAYANGGLPDCWQPPLTRTRCHLTLCNLSSGPAPIPPTTATRLTSAS